MEFLTVFLTIASILASVSMVLAIVIMTQVMKARFEHLETSIQKQSELIVILSQMLRQEDLRKKTEQLLFEKIQESIRQFNIRRKLNVVDEKPLDFPNDEK